MKPIEAGARAIVDAPISNTAEDLARAAAIAMVGALTDERVLKALGAFENWKFDDPGDAFDAFRAELIKQLTEARKEGG